MKMHGINFERYHLPPFRHAKRTTVSVEDVKLCCQRTPSLLEFIGGQLKVERRQKEEEKGL